MRVVIATDRYPGLTSAQAGAAIGSAWADRRAQVAVIPIGCAGAGLDQALADVWGADLWGQDSTLLSLDDGAATLVCSPDHTRWLLRLPSVTDPALARQGSSAVVWQALQAALAARNQQTPQLLVLDASQPTFRDGGQGLIQAAGGCQSLAEQLSGVELVLATDAEDANSHLTGLRGLTSRAAHAEGRLGTDVAALLAADQALVDLATEAGAESLIQRPGSGAAGGIGWIVQQLGGRVRTGPALCRELFGFDHTLSQADLIVTGGAALDFGTMGGEVLTEVRTAAQAALVPCVVIAGENFISPRELRSIGVEAAYSVHRSGAAPIGTAELTATAVAVSASWTW